MAIQFKDNRVAVKGALQEAITAFLHEAGGELEAQVKRNTNVDTGQLKGAWNYNVDTGKNEATVGNPLENAIWEEFGTGEFALNGDGRKGGWIYKDERTGKCYHTFGKPPKRALHSAFTKLKNPLKERAATVLKERMK